MARKTLKYTVADEGRDKGKVFVITEFAPRVGHMWATRALFAIANAGFDLGDMDSVMDKGFAGLAVVGIKNLGKINVDVGAPLLNELFECVQIMPDPSKTNVVRGLIDDDTEEILTLFKLQYEVLALHINFSTPDGQ